MPCAHPLPRSLAAGGLGPRGAAATVGRLGVRRRRASARGRRRALGLRLRLRRAGLRPAAVALALRRRAAGRLLVVLVLVGGGLLLVLVLVLVGLGLGPVVLALVLVLVLVGLGVLVGLRLLLAALVLALVLGGLLGDVAVLDDAAPRAGLLVAHLDERLEALEVGARRPLGEPRPAGDLLDRALGVDVDVELDARQAVAELVEGDDADVLHAARRPPDDPLVGHLLDDLGLPHAPDAPHLLVEDDRRVVALLHALGAVHELREVLELRPLVVDGLERRGHVDRLLDRHAPALAGAVAGATAAALVVAAAAEALAELAELAAGVLQLGQHRVLDQLGTTLHRHLGQLGRDLLRDRRQDGDRGLRGHAAQLRDGPSLVLALLLPLVLRGLVLDLVLCAARAPRDP